MIYQYVEMILLILGIAVLMVLTFRVSRLSMSLRAGGSSGTSADCRAFAASLISMMSSRNYRELLRTLNERLDANSSLIVLFDGPRMLDIQFSSRDPNASFGIPELEVSQGGFAERLDRLFEKVRNNPVIIDRGLCTSFLGGIKGDNSMTLGFANSDSVYGVLQFIGRDKPFSQKDIDSLSSHRDSLQILTRDQVMNHLQMERRRAAEVALRRIEERYRAIFDESMDMIYHADGQGKILAINAAGVRMLGFEKEEELVGLYFRDLFFDPSQWDFNSEILRTNSFIKDMEIVLRRRDGEKIFCLEGASTAFDGTGNLKGYSGIIKDISARIELNARLMRTNMELTESNSKLQQAQDQIVQSEKLASIGQLAAGLAHEINNPLGFVQSNFSTIHQYSESLLQYADKIPELDQDDREKLAAKLGIDFIQQDLSTVFSETQDGINRMAEIVHNLKGFSYQDRSGEISELDLNEAIRNTLVIARNELKYHTTVSTKLQPLPAIMCNAGEIRQVLLNMLINAAQAIKGEHMPEGVKGKIRISTLVKNDFIVCVIEDSGPGVPRDLRTKIFDPFFTTKEVGSGTGLGLSISYDIIAHKHAGRLVVNDSSLGGARFLIMLPIISADGAQELDELEE